MRGRGSQEAPCLDLVQEEMETLCHSRCMEEQAVAKPWPGSLQGKLVATLSHHRRLQPGTSLNGYKRWSNRVWHVGALTVSPYLTTRWMSCQSTYLHKTSFRPQGGWTSGT